MAFKHCGAPIRTSLRCLLQNCSRRKALIQAIRCVSHSTAKLNILPPPHTAEKRLAVPLSLLVALLFKKADVLLSSEKLDDRTLVSPSELKNREGKGKCVILTAQYCTAPQHLPQHATTAE